MASGNKELAVSILKATAGLEKFTQADLDAGIAAANAEADMRFQSLTNEAIAKSANKAADGMKKETQSISEAAKAKKQLAEKLYGGLLQIAEDYQDKLQEINRQGSEDTEEAIRDGDARALAKSISDRREALAQANRDKDASMLHLATGMLPTSSLGQAQKVAGMEGVGDQFNAMLAQFQSKYAGQAGTGGLATSMSDAATGGKGGVSVQVFVGNEELSSHVRTVIKDEVFRKPSTARPTGRNMPR
jgi:hypothetical protein